MHAIRQMVSDPTLGCRNPPPCDMRLKRGDLQSLPSGQSHGLNVWVTGLVDRGGSKAISALVCASNWVSLVTIV